MKKKSMLILHVCWLVIRSYKGIIINIYKVEISCGSAWGFAKWRSKFAFSIFLPLSLSYTHTYSDLKPGPSLDALNLSHYFPPHNFLMFLKLKASINLLSFSIMQLPYFPEHLNIFFYLNFFFKSILLLCSSL